MTSTKPLKWGIIATGGISTKFAKAPDPQDLLVDPSTRDVKDVSHVIAAVGSRSVDSARKFIDGLKAGVAPYDWGVKHGGLDGCKAIGSYQGVFDDPNVEAVYIGTPHNYHYENTRDALNAGKHVLCEKPFTMDLEELDALIALAKKKNLFLMEAVWTRFHPIAYAVQKVMASGKLGKIRRFQADFSNDADVDNKPLSHRLIAPDLAGGSLLDMGPYPSVWAMLILHHSSQNANRKAPKFLTSSQWVYPRTKVDGTSRWLLEWEGMGQALLTTDLMCAGHAPSTCLVQCEEGDLSIEWPPYKPETFHIIPHAKDRLGAIKEQTTDHHPVHAGGGMHYEADETARCIRAGKIDSERMPLEESRIVQSWLDKVRRDGDSVLKNWKGGASQ